MSKYENLRLKDKDVTPTPEVLKSALGTSYSAFTKFIDGLAKLDISNVWQYYPCVGTKAWLGRGEYRWTTPRGANKVKNIYWLSAWDGHFQMAVWFKEDNRMEILKADVTEETKQLIRKGKMFGPKMRTFPVEFEIKTTSQLNDIYTLLRLKIQLEA